MSKVQQKQNYQKITVTNKNEKNKDKNMNNSKWFIYDVSNPTMKKVNLKVILKNIHSKL